MNQRDAERLAAVMKQNAGMILGDFDTFLTNVLNEILDPHPITSVCVHGNPLRDGNWGPLSPECGCRARPWPDPLPAQLESPEFLAVWEVIRDWDIHVPGVDGPGMYTGATGNHARAILDALPRLREVRARETLSALARALSDGFEGNTSPEDTEALLRRLLCR